MAESWAAQLLDAAPDAMVVVGRDARISLVNRQAEELFGYARAELLGQALEVLIPERFRSAHAGHWARFSERPATRAMGMGLSLFGRRRDGSEIPVEVSLSPVRGPTGTAVCAAIRDISDRKRTEEATKLSADRLSSAIESVDDAIALFDAEDRLVLCNSAYRSLIGQLVSGPLIGKPYREIVEAWLATARGPGGTASRAQGLMESGNRRLTFEVETSDGRSQRVTNRRTPEGGTVQTIWDLTDDVRREKELRTAQQAAEAANLAKTEFLSSMSHELRTPLNAVLGFAQLLQRDRKEPLSGRHRERIEHILKGGQHLLTLIDEVLDLSRIETGTVGVSLESVRLEEVLSEVKSTLDSMAARAEIEVVVEPLPQDVPDVIADRTRLKQILMNYGSNAIKYGRRRGTATFRIRATQDLVRLSVLDDGIGIARDQQGRIFEPFHRAGQETGAIEGTGIGLTITKRLAELMHGGVGFESTEGKGSEFYVEVPAEKKKSDAPPAPAREELSSSPLSASGGARYLVVYIEDNPSSIALMQDILSDFAQVDLVTAPTAEIGLELVRSRCPHAVIMDINLPGMSGFEAARRLGEWPETARIPIVALSAAVRLGGQDVSRFHRYLTKPVRVDELSQVLEELLLPGTP